MRRKLAWLPRLLAGALILFATASAASAAYVIKWDMGGIMDDYYTKYDAIDQAEGKVDVEGMCVSACTMVLGLVDPSRVCAGPHAVLGFHSARNINEKTHEEKFSPEGTFILWWLYPQRVRDALIAHGWKGPDKPHPELIFIPAAELGVQPCPTKIGD